jgi:hypothetical protein
MTATWDLRDECFEQPRGGFDPPTTAWYQETGTSFNTSSFSSPSKKAHLWNAETIVRGFNFTPALYYDAENYLKKLLWHDDIHLMNFKNTGYEMRFTASPICEEMLRKYKWLNNKDVPYWFRVSALDGLIARVANDMRVEKYDEDKTSKVNWSKRLATALPKPKTKDPYPLQFCSLKIIDSEEEFEDQTIALKGFIGRKADKTLDLNKIQFHRFMNPKELNVLIQRLINLFTLLATIMKTRI